MANYSGAHVPNVQNNAIGNNIAQGSAHQYNANAIYFGTQENLLSVLPVAAEAPFNSFNKRHDPLCLPDTRVGVLQMITLWADGQDERCIFWLNGIAGTGKSTVARTIARRYYNQKRLGASFFFSRGGGDVSQANKFFTTIAVQLAKHSEVLKGRICEAIDACRDIGNKEFRDQWNQLILQPIAGPQANLLQAPLLVVVDALDECGDDDDIKAILRCLAELNSQCTTRLRIFITSRPELPVRLGFREMPEIAYHDLVLQNVPRSIIDRDISVFLREKFREMRNTFKYLSIDWPGEKSITLLVKRSEGLFIFAATVCRFVQDDEEGTPEELLHIVLPCDGSDAHYEPGSNISSNSPTLELDDMYITVLKHSFEKVKRDRVKIIKLFRKVIGSLVVLFKPLSEVALSGLLHITPEKVNLRLRRLHSVLNIPKKEEDPIHLAHPSFRDFLLDRNRCLDQTFWVDERQRHRDLYECCLRLLSSKLQKDILGLQAPGSLAIGVTRSQVEQHILPEVKYACLYWIKHLYTAEFKSEDLILGYVWAKHHQPVCNCSATPDVGRSLRRRLKLYRPKTFTLTQKEHLKLLHSLRKQNNGRWRAIIFQYFGDRECDHTHSIHRLQND